MEGNPRSMSIMVRPDSGTKTRAANQRDVNKHINELQQELTKSRAETQRVKDKLSCLISLVRRSWNGDRNASIHLANIIGLDLPPTLLDTGTTGRPGTRMQTPSTMNSHHRAVVNWERMTVKLLQRDYEQMQSEIREYQQRYIENRSRFMDEVMHHHQQDMSRTPCSRPSSAKLSTVDQQFLQVYSKVTPEGRLPGRKPPYRCKSAVSRGQPKVHRDVVEQAEVRLRDLFVESSAPVSLTPGMPAADASLAGTKEKPVVKNKRMQQDYDDSHRYSQGNLYTMEEIRARKPRPMSAAVLRERDQQRARPRSAVTLNTIGTELSSGDRPLKYETTRPVPGHKSAAGKGKKSSSSSSAPQVSPTTNNISSDPLQEEDDLHNPNNSFTEGVPVFTEDLEEEASMTAQQPPISVRVKNAITRPESVDRFSKDLRHMEQMEKQFKIDTMTLQKKLGLPENGLV